MRIYAYGAYISMILFINQIEHPSHARKVVLLPVQVSTNDAGMYRGDARMWRDDEDTTSTGKSIFCLRATISTGYYANFCVKCC